MVNSSITNKKAEFTGFLHDVGGPMNQYVIVVPEEVCMIFKEGKGAVRILCSVNGGEEFPCALNPRQGGYVIISSKQLIKKHKLAPHVPFNVRVRSDVHDGLQLPEELLEVMIQDERFSYEFEKLLPGRKRGLIYYIRSAKTVDTRIKRSLEIAEKVKTGTLYGSNQND